jgi:hypothetical protein
MNTQNRVRAQSSAARVNNQTQNTAAATAPASIEAAELSGAREEAMKQNVARWRNATNMPLSPNLYLWAAYEISDVDALIYMAQAIYESEAAFVEYARGVRETIKPDSLALLSVAKGIAEGEKNSSGASRRAMQTGEMGFPSLPGLLGRRRVKVREVMDYVSWFLVEARQVVMESIVPGMKDRRSALRLVEALVLALE